MQNSRIALIALALTCLFCIQISEGALSISRAPLGLMRTLHTNGFGSEGEEVPANAIQQGDGLWISMPATRAQRSYDMSRPFGYAKRAPIFIPAYE